MGCWGLPLAPSVVDDRGVPVPSMPERLLTTQLTTLTRSAGLTAGSGETGRAGSEERDRLWPSAIKTGQLGDERVVGRVAELVEDAPSQRYVLDPELNDRSGRPRSAEVVAVAVRSRLLHQAAVVVCNRHEAAALTGRSVDSPSSMRDGCKALFDQGARVVLVTGAHLEGFPRDLYYDGTGFEEFGADRVALEGGLLGAGGLLSAVVAGRLAAGYTAIEAINAGREAVDRGLRRALYVTEAGVVEAGGDVTDLPRGGFWVPDLRAAAG
jgi:hydroxymethylpyrimidine kinase/phosphomethylpyrimidine kinase